MQLILKREKDLVTSISHLGHAMLKAIDENIFQSFNDIKFDDENLKNNLKKQIDYLKNIADDIKKLGSVKMFDANLVDSKIEHYQILFNGIFKNILNITKDLKKNKDANLQNFITSCEDFAKNDKRFFEFLKKSSENRQQKVNDIIYSTSFSAIGNVIKVNWSTKNFLKAYEKRLPEIFDKKVKPTIRELLISQIPQLTERYARKNKRLSALQDFIDNRYDDLLEFVMDMNTTCIIEIISDTMRNAYLQVFEEGEGLDALIGNIPVVINTYVSKGDFTVKDKVFSEMINGELVKTLSVFYEEGLN